MIIPPPPNLPANFNQVLLPLVRKYSVFAAGSPAAAAAAGPAPAAGLPAANKGVQVKAWLEQAKDPTVHSESPSGVCWAAVDRWLAAQHSKASVQGFRAEFANGIPSAYATLQREKDKEVDHQVKGMKIVWNRIQNAQQGVDKGAVPSWDEVKALYTAAEGVLTTLSPDERDPRLSHHEVCYKDPLVDYRALAWALIRAVQASPNPLPAGAPAPADRLFRLAIFNAQGVQGHAIGLRCQIAKAMWRMLDPNTGEWTHIRSAIFVDFLTDYFPAVYRKRYDKGFYTIVEASIKY
jgi:hypothetical protein